MELQGEFFEKTELQKIAEEIYELETEKKNLELALQSEKFHSHYIPKRKNILVSKFIIQLILMVFIVVIIAVSLKSILWLFLDVYLLFVLIRIAWDETKLFRILFGDKNSATTIDYNEKYNMRNIRYDKDVSDERIQMLEEQILSLNGKISQLKRQRKILLEEMEAKDEFLRQKGILYDKKPDAEKGNGKFKLNENSIAMGKVQDLIEFYEKEEQYTNTYLSQVKVELQHVNKEIIQIDDDFEQFKRISFYAIAVFVLVVIIQSCIPGAFGIATDILCSIFTVVAFLILESKYKNAIILYLIEHDHPLIQEYAFRYNILPVYLYRKDLLEKIQSIQNDLDKIKKKKLELEA